MSSSTSPASISPGDDKPMHHRLNIVLFGGVGAGKSSVVNLIMGSDVAQTSSGSSSCMDAKPYDVTIQGRDFRIFDTVGLYEPHSLRDPDCLIGAIYKAYCLIKSLSDAGGINLLVFCARRGRVTVDMKQNYELFHDFLCHKKVPVALVVTHLEQEENVEDWWLQNHPHFTECGIHIIDYACITAKREFSGRYHASRQLVHDLLLNNGCGVPFTAREGRLDSFKVRAKKLREYGLRENEIAVLLNAIDEDHSPATISPGYDKPIQHRSNIVLFGEMGAGKSSVVNLIIGSDVARTSPGASGCTLDARPYDVTIQGRDFRIFDTVGLCEPHSFRDPDRLIGAIYKAYCLIKSLSDAGGVNLLVFCVRRGRVTVDMQQNYKLFHDFLCHKKVPIALVITHLEHEEHMEDWWLHNHPHLTECGIHTIDHACITAKREFSDRYHASRQLVHDLLIKHGCSVPPTARKGRLDSFKIRAKKLREYGLRENEIAVLLRKMNDIDED